MKALTIGGAVMLALALALPSSAQTPATAKSPQSLCKPDELEFLTAWKAPEGPGGWAEKPAKQSLSVCASNFDDLGSELIHLRMGKKGKLVLDKSFETSDVKFELQLGNGHELTTSFGIYDDSPVKIQIWEVFRMDSAVGMSSNIGFSGSFALFEPQFKPYVGRGMIGLLEWIAARREQRSATFHAEWAKGS